ncbi:AraC-type DNA-binding protein [Dysgonomonas macrotermitis]|uniref:histidine kinase n=2 Tax=Dysgonomonas macrotermitis TaxID=1346286 RepID=A0A1M4WG73_9BACT|nr:AraC-type DNA-binding protein [Dysgonomonas macrotermitis]
MLLLLLVICGIVNAGKLIDYRTMLSRDLLEDNAIVALTKDNKGFVWIATPAALARFDGSSYSIINKEGLIKLFDGKNSIYQLSFQTPDILWICSNIGLFSYNIRTHQLEQIEELAGLRVNSMIIEKNILYLNTVRGIMQYFPEEKKLNILYALKTRGSTSLAVDINGYCWFATDRHLLRLSGFAVLKKAFDKKETIKADTLLTYTTNQRILIDSLNIIWIWDKERLTTAKISGSGTLENIKHQNIEITAIHLLANNNLILCKRGQGNEILYRDKNGNNIQTEKFLATLQYDDLTNTTNVFYVDELENIWIGTRDGLFMLPFGRRNKVHTLANDINNHSTLSHNTVSSIFVDEKNNIWVGTAYGLNKLQHEGSGYSIKKYIDNRPTINHVQDNKIEQITIDSKGIMWLGTKRNLKFYNPATDTYISKPNIEKALAGNNFVKALLRDRSNKVWVGYQSGGLYVVDEVNNSVKRIDFQSISWDNCTSIQEDIKNVIWASSKVNGILKIEFDNEEQKFKTRQYQILNQIQSTIPVNCLYIDNYSNIWAGTESGLYKFSEEKDGFIAMEIDDSGRNINIVGIISDTRGNLWIACTSGIYKYNISEARSYYFSLYDGQLTRPGFVFSCNIDRNGIIYMSGINGLTYFDPESIATDQTHYQVRFTDFRVNNKALEVGSDYLKEDLNFTDKIFLDHKTNQFSFSFAALAYNDNNNKLKHAYKLDGVDKDWIYAGAAVPIISYNNLSPGEYTLHIKSTDLNGIWLDNTESLNILIKPAFYQTWYFYSLLLICLAILGWIAFRIQKNQKNLQAQKKTAQSKLDLYTDISYSIKTPLALLQTPLDNLTKHYNAMSEEEIKYMLAVMLRNSNRLSLLVDQLIEFKQVSEADAKLELVEDDFISFAKNIYDGFYDLFSKKEVDFSFTSNVEKQTLVFDPSKMETVIFNLLFSIYKVIKGGEQLVFKCIYDESQHELQVALVIQKENSKPESDRILKNMNPSIDVGIPLAGELLKLHHSKLIINDKTNAVSFSISSDTPHIKGNMVTSDGAKSLAISDLYANYIEYQSLGDTAIEDYLPHAPLVYLADTDKEMARFIKNVCAPSLMIKTFTNTSDLYNKVLSVKPNLIISEVVFDGKKQGLELCEKVKNDHMLNDIPFLILTSYTSDLDKKNGYEAGCNAYIFKPFDISFLKRRIQSLVENQENIREKIKLELITNPQKIEMQSSDEKFLSRCMNIIEENMQNEDFNVEMFAEAMNLSTSMLYRRIKNITNLGPNDLIKSIRLKRAAQLLTTDALRISEVAEKVGFLDVRYFSTCFKKEFGVTPSQYLKKGDT